MFNKKIDCLKCDVCDEMNCDIINVLKMKYKYMEINEMPPQEKPEEKKQFEQIDGFEEGIEWHKQKITEVLKEKGKVVITIIGKTGAGKSSFSRELQELLNKDDLLTKIIHTDVYRGDRKRRLREPIHEERTFDAEKLKKDIRDLEGTPVIILEGVDANDEKKLGLVSDIHSFVDSKQLERFGRRMLRDNDQEFRSFKENLLKLAEIVVEKPEYMGDEINVDLSNVDIIVNNTYQAEGSPQIYLNNNELVFEHEGIVQEAVQVNEKQIQALAKFGFGKK
jgi:uridine kinase